MRSPIPPAYDRARAAVAYTDVARRMVQNLKFRDRTELAPWMAGWMMRVGSELMTDLPRHRAGPAAPAALPDARLQPGCRTRPGRLGGKERSPISRPRRLRRRKPTRQQVGLGLAQRQTNVRGAFEVSDAASILVKGRRVLLVDDVPDHGRNRFGLRAGPEAGRRNRRRRARFRPRFAGGLPPGGARFYIDGETRTCGQDI